MKKILIAVGAALLMVSNAFAETSRAYLETIDLEDLCITYSENRQGVWVASVKDPDGHYHTVTVGSYIGKDNGRIMKITNDTVEVVEIIQDGAGGWVERPLTLELACHDMPPCAHSPSDGSHIAWLMSKRGKRKKDRFTWVYLGLSVHDRRTWRWVYGESRGIEPATAEEAKELKEKYGDADLSSSLLPDGCPPLRRLELKWLSSKVRASAKELKNLLAEDFVEFEGSGRVLNKESMIDSLTRGGPMPEVDVRDFTVRELCNDAKSHCFVTLATYRLLRWSDSGEKIEESLRSSIWAFRQPRWQLIFHQSTRR